MALPEEDLPQFPVGAAEALADELDELATKLAQAAEARATAGADLPEFQGAVAAQFRLDLQAHTTAAGDVVARFRQTAGALRDAVEEHRAARRQILATVGPSGG
jgi:hypothetical protein